MRALGCMYQAGELLADGWFGCVWGLVGDHDYKRDCLELPNISSGTQSVYRGGEGLG